MSPTTYCFLVGLLGFQVLLSGVALGQSANGEPESVASSDQELRIRVLDRKHLGARVLVDLNLQGSTVVSAYTDWSGNLTLQGPFPGKYTVVIRIAGDEVYRKHLIISDGQKAKSAVLRLSNVTFEYKTEQVTVNNLGAPAKAYKLYSEGMNAIRSGNLKEALLRLDHALQIYPAYSESHNARGVALHMMKRNEEAEEEFRSALQFDINSFEPRFNLGKLLLEANRPVEAKVELQKAFELNHRNDAAADLLVDSMLMMHDTDSAILLANSLERSGFGDLARIHLRIASELSKQGMVELAVEQYSLVLRDEASPLERHEAETAISLMRYQETRDRSAD